MSTANQDSIPNQRSSKKGWTLSGFLGGAFKQIDRFGYPISLTYNDDVTFKSPFGGFMTLLAIISLMIYFFMMLATAINQTKYTLTNSQYIKDLYFDKTLYNYTTD